MGARDEGTVGYPQGRGEKNETGVIYTRGGGGGSSNFVLLCLYRDSGPAPLSPPPPSPALSNAINDRTNTAVSRRILLRWYYSRPTPVL